MRSERFGEGWLLIPERLPDAAIGRARALTGIVRAVRRRCPDRDVVLGGSSVLLLGEDAPPAVSEGDAAASLHSPVSHTIEVVYDGEELGTIAADLAMDVEAVARLHHERPYVALLTGFMPGFAYLGDVDPRLARPRLAQPRRRVPAGAVGIAGSLTGVYPFASPGGWNLLGRAVDPRLFDPEATPPVRIAPLDEVRFVPVHGESRPPRTVRHAGVADEREALLVEATSAIATVQDRGRFGLRGHGLPWSGPLDHETHEAANLAVGNPLDAATIEVISGSITLRARDADLWMSMDGRPAVRVAAGQSFTAAPGAALVSYVAVRGGINVPVVLGSRSTLLVASLGGHEGRPLKRGDVLPIGADPGSTVPAATSSPDVREDPVVLRVTPSLVDQRLAPEAFEVLLASQLTVSSALDRVGLRLEGGRVPRAGDDRGLPAPMLPGAIQVTTDGTPIVLGPDAAVTGGYPVVGHLDPPSRWAISRIRPGSRVRFDKS